MLFLPIGLQEQDNINAQIDLLPKLTPKMLRTWSKDYYGSGNTVISITGKFDRKKLLKGIKTKLQKEHQPRIRPYYKNIFKAGIDVQYHPNKNIDNTTIFFAFWSPLFFKDKEVYFIELFKELKFTLFYT